MGRMALVVSLLVCGAMGNALAQTKSFTKEGMRAPALTVDISQEPKAKQLVSNGRIRAYRIDLSAGGSTSVDRHEHDFLVISLGSNDFELAGSDNAYAMSMSDGEVQVLKGRWPHRVTNKSEKELHIIEVEAVRDIAPENATCGLNAQSCIGAKFAVKDDINYIDSPLFETSTMRLGKVEIGPGKGMPEHGHRGDHLMIALNEQQLTNAVVAGDILQMTSHPGDAFWMDAGTVHRVMNRGSVPARFLTIECK